jgi:hypothetical protein
LFAILLLFLFQKLKTQKYLLFFFGFVKVAAEFSLRDSIGAWYSFHIIQATQLKGNNDDI